MASQVLLLLHYEFKVLNVGVHLLACESDYFSGKIVSIHPIFLSRVLVKLVSVTELSLNCTVWIQVFCAVLFWAFLNLTLEYEGLTILDGSGNWIGNDVVFPDRML